MIKPDDIHSPASPSISPEQCAAIVHRLLAPDEAERLMADQLLAALYIHEALDEAVSRKSFALIDRPEVFLPALVSYWAQSALEGHNRWMAACGMKTFHAGAPAWLSSHDTAFPFAPCEEKPDFGLFLGISQWLEKGPGPAGGEWILPQLTACLEHPVCGNAAVAILRSMGSTAKLALPALLKHIRSKYGAVRLFDLDKTAASLIGNDTALAEQLARELSPTSRLSLVEMFCHIFDHLSVPVPAVVDTLLALQEYTPVQRRSEWILTLLPCTARLAKKADHRCAEVRRLALFRASQSEPLLREAAAFALGEVYAPTTDEALLIKLSRDHEWPVRHAAHHAAANVAAPSPELVRTTAQDLGNYDGCDGLPHDGALTALIHWGERSSPAIDAIARWLESEEMNGDLDTSTFNRLTDLFNALGNAARSALPAWQKLRENWMREDCAPPDEIDGEDETPMSEEYEEQNARFAAFVAQFGIDAAALSFDTDAPREQP